MFFIAETEFSTPWPFKDPDNSSYVESHVYFSPGTNCGGLNAWSDRGIQECHLHENTLNRFPTGELSVSNRSKFAGRFRFQFHPNPDHCNGSYHTKNSDHWKWAGFTTKNLAFQVHNFGSK